MAHLREVGHSWCWTVGTVSGSSIGSGESDHGIEESRE